jgi:hypothetical protein
MSVSKWVRNSYNFDQFLCCKKLGEGKMVEKATILQHFGI